MKVSIVIPNWNGAEKLKRNLPEAEKVVGVDEIIVVDDGSTDKSVEFIESEFPKVKLFKKTKNSGFSSTVNLGFERAQGEFVFLLNSDAVPEPDCVKKVLRHFKERQVFSIGFNTGGSWAWGYFKDGFFWHGQAKDKPKEVHQTMWASGGSGIFRKDVWEQLGGLDELMDPFYWEDVDIGYRATKSGYVNLWDPNAKVEHYKDLESSPSEKLYGSDSRTLPFSDEKGKEKGVIEENFSKEFVDRISRRNQLIFIWKNITDSYLIWQHIWSLFKMLITHPKYWQIFLPAFWKLSVILHKRGIEKKQSKLTDKQVLEKFKL